MRKNIAHLKTIKSLLSIPTMILAIRPIADATGLTYSTLVVMILFLALLFIGAEFLPRAVSAFFLGRQGWSC